MRTLDRYALSQFLRIFLVFVLGVPFMLIVFDVADNIDDYLDTGVGWGRVILHYVYQFPYQSLIGFPIASLLAAVFTISNMSAKSEITAMKAAGVSFYRLTTPLIGIGVLLSVAALGLTELVAVTNRKSTEALEITEERVEAYRSAFVYRADQGLVYKVRTLDTLEMQMRDVQVVREGSGPTYPTLHITAPTAAYDSAVARWVLEDGWLRRIWEPEEVRAYQFTKLYMNDFDESAAELRAEPKEQDDMRWAELGRHIAAIDRSGGITARLETERALRLSYPFTCLVIILFGLPLAHSSKRGGTPTAIGLALGTTILFMIFTRISEAMGAGAALPPNLAAWLPNLAFFVTGLILFWRIRT